MVVDRINRAILNFIRKKSGVRLGPVIADASGLKLMDGENAAWTIAWRDIVRITALRSPGFVGDTIILTIEAEGESRIVSEEQSGWSALAQALPTHLPGALQHKDWVLPLVAGGEQARVTVYERR